MTWLAVAVVGGTVVFVTLLVVALCGAAALGDEVMSHFDDED